MIFTWIFMWESTSWSTSGKVEIASDRVHRKQYVCAMCIFVSILWYFIDHFSLLGEYNTGWGVCERERLLGLWKKGVENWELRIGHWNKDICNVHICKNLWPLFWEAGLITTSTPRKVHGFQLLGLIWTWWTFEQLTLNQFCWSSRETKLLVRCWVDCIT